MNPFTDEYCKEEIKRYGILEYKNRKMLLFASLLGLHISIPIPISLYIIQIIYYTLLLDD